jgi:hypothetical protein
MKIVVDLLPFPRRKIQVYRPACLETFLRALCCLVALIQALRLELARGGSSRLQIFRLSSRSVCSFQQVVVWFGNISSAHTRWLNLCFCNLCSLYLHLFMCSAIPHLTLCRFWSYLILSFHEVSYFILGFGRLCRGLIFRSVCRSTPRLTCTPQLLQLCLDAR